MSGTHGLSCPKLKSTGIGERQHEGRIVAESEKSYIMLLLAALRLFLPWALLPLPHLTDPYSALN